MTRRRHVVVDRAFLELVDSQFPSDRGPDGEPCATDFLLIDLPVIADAFATGFDKLMTPIPERPDYRSLLSVGSTVARILVTGQLRDDGSVVLLSLAVDRDAAW